MKRTYTCAIALLSLGLIGAASQDHPQNSPGDHPAKPKTAKVGESAPTFTLEDHRGEEHSLGDYKGRIVVLEWFNEGCPFCKGVWECGLMPTMLEEINGIDDQIVYLAVNSTANRAKDKVVQGGGDFLKKMDSDIPMLIDYDGVLGHLYEAKTTPHVYIIDEEGVPQFQGALSDDPLRNEGAKAETHVVRVIKQLKAGEEVEPSYVKPWGCSVKYARSGDRSRPSKPRPPKRGTLTP